MRPPRNRTVNNSNVASKISAETAWERKRIEREVAVKVMTEIKRLKDKKESVYSVANKMIQAYKNDLYSSINYDLINYQIRLLKAQMSSLQSNTNLILTQNISNELSDSVSTLTNPSFDSSNPTSPVTVVSPSVPPPVPPPAEPSTDSSVPPAQGAPSVATLPPVQENVASVATSGGRPKGSTVKVKQKINSDVLSTKKCC